MNKKYYLLFMIAMWFGVVAGRANGPGESDPDQFIRRLYAPYSAGDTRFDPTGEGAPLIFSPQLVKLIRLDIRRAHGEVGALDGDPLCDCQDLDHFRLLTVQTSRRTAAEAVMRLRIFNGGWTEMVTYWLAKGRSGWRVTDIESNGVPSLVALLQDGAKH